MPDPRPIHQELTPISLIIKGEDANMPNYPEHEKLQAVREKSRAVGGFLEWVWCEKQLQLGKWHRGKDELPFTSDSFEPERYDVQKLLAEFFGIDYDVLQAEKEAMYQGLRAQASVAPRLPGCG
jgi:hypothetical protein